MFFQETLTHDVISNEEKDKIPTAFINIGYPGEKGKNLLKKCFEKLGCSSNQTFNFVCCYSVTKFCFSLIWKISWTSLVNQMLFTSFGVLVVNLPILEKLSEHSLKEQKNK